MVKRKFIKPIPYNLTLNLQKILTYLKFQKKTVRKTV